MAVKQVFVGRERQLEELFAILDKALKGQGQVVFITGETGTGKTELAREFFRRAQERYKDLIVAVGECTPQGICFPYLPFSEIMALLLGAVEGKPKEKLISPENQKRLRGFAAKAAEIAIEFSPEVIAAFNVPLGLIMKLLTATGRKKLQARLESWRRAEAPQRMNGEFFRERISGRFINLLSHLAAQTPLALLLDDLQWADTHSIGLLSYLGRRLNGHRVLVIGIFRPHDVAAGREGERHPLEQVYNELRRYGCHTLNLDLSEAVEEEREEIWRFVDEYIDANYGGLDGGFKRLIAERTEGNALFVVELVRDIEERGWIEQDGAGWRQVRPIELEELPDKIEAVIDERLGRLPDEFRHILAAASVEGEEFTAQVVARVQGMAEDEMVDILADELGRRHQLVVEAGQYELPNIVLDLFRFRHTLFRERLYERLTKAQRRMLHAQVGEALEALYGEESHRIALSLVRHFHKGRDYEGVTRHVLTAARGFAAGHAMEATEAICRLGREALAKLPTSEENLRLRVDLDLQLAKALDFLGHYDDGLELLIETQSIAEQLDDEERIARAYHWLGTMHWRRGENDEAIGIWRKQLALAEELEDRAEIANVCNSLGLAYDGKGEHDRAIEWFKKSLKISEELEDRVGLARTCWNIGLLYRDIGPYELAREYLERAKEIWEGLGYEKDVREVEEILEGLG